MIKDILSEIHPDLPIEGSRREEFTRRAFEMLPRLHKPRILDIGCSQGGPTLELAKLSQGEIVGIDIHQPRLDEFSERTKQAGFSDCIKVVNCSMFHMDFPEESFDVLWAEGSIFVSARLWACFSFMKEVILARESKIRYRSARA